MHNREKIKFGATDNTLILLSQRVAPSCSKLFHVTPNLILDLIKLY